MNLRINLHVRGGPCRRCADEERAEVTKKIEFPEGVSSKLEPAKLSSAPPAKETPFLPVKVLDSKRPTPLKDVRVSVSAKLECGVKNWSRKRKTSS